MEVEYSSLTNESEWKRVKASKCEWKRVVVHDELWKYRNFVQSKKVKSKIGRNSKDKKQAFHKKIVKRRLRAGNFCKGRLVMKKRGIGKQLCHRILTRIGYYFRYYFLTRAQGSCQISSAVGRKLRIMCNQPDSMRSALSLPGKPEQNNLSAEWTMAPLKSTSEVNAQLLPCSIVKTLISPKQWNGKLLWGSMSWIAVIFSIGIRMSCGMKLE